jgi:hypothetical protein
MSYLVHIECFCIAILNFIFKEFNMISSVCFCGGGNVLIH